ncbi:ankyrin repeat domain-containing protein [Galbibacter mesophilus]|uniref:ankyrin repeat domain-containing protein n=1 Tax=Galbibacter mesophilus TaxID=379069 RepID=UPI00191CF54A|nr:ankyrin repeat domain-containing protein [Galbibacter mesophilus]MCM5663680.1 ankyrin repeat domain-containing protein [Galbibacter mesophilus]
MKKLALLTAVFLTAGITFANTSKNEKVLNDEVTVLATRPAPKLSPFCMSIVKGDLATVQKLLSLGANVNEKSVGRTPAMYAARYNRAEILELLIAHDADLKAKCSGKGLTAMEYAKQSNAVDAIAILEKH